MLVQQHLLLLTTHCLLDANHPTNTLPTKIERREV